jgi:integrase
MAILAQCPICRTKQKVANKRCRCGEDMDKAKKANRVQYWVSYYLPGKKNRREPVGFSIDEARAAEGKRRAQKKEGRFFEMLPETKKTFNQLAEWFTGQKKIKALSYFVSIQAHLKLFNAELGDRLTNSLTPSDLENLQVELKGAGYAPSYIDQTIDTARYMVTKAFDNDQIGGDCLKPFRKVAAVLKRGANARKRILTMAEYTRLQAACPAHLQCVVALGFWTGMRVGEILPLTWEKVDLPARMIRLHSTDTKEAMSKTVPIPKRVRDMLLTLPHRGKG